VFPGRQEEMTHVDEREQVAKEQTVKLLQVATIPIIKVMIPGKGESSKRLIDMTKDLGKRIRGLQPQE